MRALEPLHGLRVVADPAAIDTARWAPADGSSSSRVIVLRIAPDEAFAVHAAAVELDDPHAIVEPDAGFAGCWLSAAELDREVVPHVEWQLPASGPALAQGSIAGVPAKLLLAAPTGEGRAAALLVTATAYAAELEARLR